MLQLMGDHAVGVVELQQEFGTVKISESNRGPSKSVHFFATKLLLVIKTASSQWFFLSIHFHIFTYFEVVSKECVHLNKR